MCAVLGVLINEIRLNSTCIIALSWQRKESVLPTGFKYRFVVHSICNPLPANSCFCVFGMEYPNCGFIRV